MTEQLPPRRQLRRPGAPRAARHVVKVTAEQEARLVELAAVRRVTIPRLLVESVLQPAVTVQRDPIGAEVAAELFGITRALGQVGVNVNQLAKVANSTGEVPAATAGALAALERVCGRLQVFADQLEQR